jgi:hypothetical protein
MNMPVEPPPFSSTIPFSTIVILLGLLAFKHETVMESVTLNANIFGVSEYAFIIGSILGICVLMVLMKYATYTYFLYKRNAAERVNHALILQNERDALLKIFDSLGGKYWSKSANWCSPSHVSTWKGVKIDHSTGRVVKLLLAENNLSGRIPEEIGVFSDIKEIDFRFNNIEGCIPLTLCSLTKLEGLYLYNNRIGGTYYILQ